MSDGIAPANPSVSHTNQVERLGSDATGTETAAESFTRFLEDEGKPDPQSRPARRANAEKRERKAEGDGADEAGDGQGRERQPAKRERSEGRQGEDDEPQEADPLHDDILDGEAPEDATDDDDTDDEGRDDEGDDNPEDEAEPEDEDPEHEVTVNGEKKSVKQSELLASYSREADYRQKTEVLARDVEQIHEFAGALNERRGHADTLVQMAEDLINAILPSDADWAALKNSNPAEFIKAQEQWQGFIGKATELRAKRDEANGHKTEEGTAEQNRYIREQNRLLFDKLPQLRNPKVQKQFSDKIFAYGKRMGYTPEELAKGLVNHRDIQTAYFAARYLEIQDSRKAQSKNTVKKGPRASEGNSTPRTPQSQRGRDNSRRANRQQAADRELQRTGSQQSAIKVFNAMFD